MTNDVSASAKKLELQISLQENPVVLRDEKEGDPSAIVRGQVTVISRESQPLRMIQVLLTGTKVLESTQQMGGTGSNKRVLIKEAKILDHEPSLTHYAQASYSLPFEFALPNSLPPTMNVPRCSVEYSISATALKCESAPPLLRLFSSKPPSTLIDLRLVRYKTTAGDLPDHASPARPVVKVGTLGAIRNGRGTLPYRVIMDKAVAAPGSSIGFKLDVYPPGEIPDFSPAEFADLINLVTTSAKSSPASGDENAGDHHESEEPEPTDAHSAISTPRSLLPPTYNAPEHTDGWAMATAAALANNKATVAAYKVHAKLVQRVCYLTDHDLVADTNDSVYLFWTKRVVCEKRVSNCLDISQTTMAGGDQAMHLDWTMTLPDDLQYDVTTPDIQHGAVGLDLEVPVDDLDRVQTLAISFSAGPTEALSSIELHADFILYCVEHGSPGAALAVFDAFCRAFDTAATDIHVVVQAQGLDEPAVRRVLKGYFSAWSIVTSQRGLLAWPVAPAPALFTDAGAEPAGLMALFGGQRGVGSYVDETVWLFDVYRPLLLDYVSHMSAFLHRESQDRRA
ncbi:hypothetical protein GGI04_002393 [Coemansia thaxteri]|nr:hypothetical protein GGI04_002393 [Coemansia thaxteri]KAJ2471628.1 hypothetical protein GGI02_002147 [Coemansia sp. RSA 2322]